jgi:hypothetical protein
LKILGITKGKRSNDSISQGKFSRSLNSNKEKDEKIEEQDKQIQQVCSEIKTTKSNFKDNINRLALEVEDLKLKINAKVKRIQN